MAHKIRKISPIATVLLWFTTTLSVSAQTGIDTLRYSVTEVENQFLQNNLSLLAQKLNINQAEARILQAKAWPNPTFTLGELQLYRNSTTDEIPPVFGNFWRDRNFAVQIEQLLLTAGKRKKNISLEIRNKEMAEILFTELLQALRVELRQTISEIQYLQNIRQSWQIQLGEVTRLVKTKESQLREGYISQAELYRLKALQISLQGEINALSEQMNLAQKELKTLMFVDPEAYIIVTSPPDTHSIDLLKKITLSEIIQLSDNNPKLRAAGQGMRINEAVLAIENANRIPNITLVSNYDRNGSTMRNFIGVGASIDLPVFNKNKGNIRAAGLEVEKSNLLQKNIAYELRNMIVQHWTDLHQSIKLYESIDADYVSRLDQLTASLGKNFSDHNISLLEFLDYYESFRESKEQYYNVQKKIIMQLEDLNYLIGGDL